jgi:hypothetical protein
MFPHLTRAIDLFGEAGQVNGGNGDRPTQIQVSGLQADLENIWDKVQLYFGVLGGLAMLYIIWNGIRYVTSQGDPKKSAEAKQAIIQAVLGVALIVAAGVVVAFIWALARTLANGSSL